MYVQYNDITLIISEGSTSCIIDAPAAKTLPLPMHPIITNLPEMFPTKGTVTNIGMKRCLDPECPSNKYYNQLKKYGLIDSQGYAISPVPEWDRLGKNGKPIPHGFYILKNQCTKNDIYDREAHMRIQDTLEETYAKYCDMLSFRKEFSHIGLCVSLNHRDELPGKTLDPYIDDRYHDNYVTIVCPYCESIDIVTNLTGSSEDEFDVIDKEHVENLITDGYLSEIDIPKPEEDVLLLDRDVSSNSIDNYSVALDRVSIMKKEKEYQWEMDMYSKCLNEGNVHLYSNEEEEVPQVVYRSIYHSN